MKMWYLTTAGGNLVLNDMMSAGALVSFMLYVASLNGAFQVRHTAFMTCSGGGSHLL